MQLKLLEFIQEDTWLEYLNLKKFYILVPLNILIKYMYHTSPNPYIMVFKTCYLFIIETKNVTQMNVWPIKWYGFEKTQKVTGWCNTILKVIYINV